MGFLSMIGRIIPADAGSTSLSYSESFSLRDHPRGCGEHFIAAVSRHGGGGSSPRMRGAQHLKVRPLSLLRIIPADAGSTSAGAPGSPADPDHPRGCGEHISNSNTEKKERGSSPRMRGARSLTRFKFILDGDHPRGCGEHDPVDCLAEAAIGSSPRMRGALISFISRWDRYRIIPADAGSTYRRSCATAWTRDHPRGCGEHT